MHSRNLKFIIDQATDRRQSHRLALAVRDSIEVGFIVPSVLRKNLADAGYTVVEDEMALAEHGFRSLEVLDRTIVKDGEKILGMGAAGDHDEALVAAMLGWFRENALPGTEVPEGIATLPT
jgi:hypothetical protein